MANPISINGKVYINLEIYEASGEATNFQLTIDSFESATIITECDNMLPICEITFKLPDYSLLNTISKSETTFMLTASDVQENVEADDVKYRITNYNIRQGSDGKIYYTLYGILKSDKYDKDIAIKSFKDMNTFEVFKKLDLGEIMLDEEDLYESNDKQTWIQHNCSTKEFITRMLKNAYIEDGDSPLSAITLDKKLRVLSIRKAFEKAAEQIKPTTEAKEQKESVDKQETPAPLVTFSNHEAGAIRYSGYTVTTNRGIIQKAFIDDRQQPVIDMYTQTKIRETNTIFSAILSVFGYKQDTPTQETKPSGTYGNGIDYPILINAGNCHANYYKALINNIKAKALLHSLNIDLVVDLKYFKEKELKVLDIVQFKPLDDKLQPIVEISGLYMVTKKMVSFSNGKNTTQLTLSKILL